ncbi:hypothetical protein QE152_g22616 [Popillia japonica]|uniref:Uncharacterized protein n=1 Tax=Popillia japonica TaxID=7064 RepID=A0AAW1KLF0_POPJA
MEAGPREVSRPESNIGLSLQISPSCIMRAVSGSGILQVRSPIRPYIHVYIMPELLMSRIITAGMMKTSCGVVCMDQQRADSDRVVEGLLVLTCSVHGPTARNDEDIMRGGMHGPTARRF